MSVFHLLFFYLLVLIIVFCKIGFYSGNFKHSANENENRTAMEQGDRYSTHRKLMLHGACTTRDISISQSRYPASGIPQFIVQIVNTCTSTSGCAPSDIHLHCGWFASARIVNPASFKRLSFDDCLINGGRPLEYSQIITFTYANTFMYPLQFKSAKFC